jgi:iron complex outermembrane receptor protein
MTLLKALLSGPIFLGLILSAPAEAKMSVTPEIELPHSHHAVDLVAQNRPTEDVQVTGIRLNPTAAGLEIILDTQDDQALAVDAIPFTPEGNALIAEIPNAVLALPKGKSFQAVNPTADIAQVSVEQRTTNSILIRVAGNTAPPTTKVTLKAGARVTSTKPEAEGEEEELVVTEEQENDYRVPNSSTATKTDTPLRDIPGSVQIIPRQLLEDRQVTRIQQIADNVPGLRPDPFNSNVAPSAGSFIIRGFSSVSTNFRDGFRDYGSVSPVDLAGVEQIEVLKGPASVLYGQSQPGGIINIVSKKPLNTPQYIVNFTAGSFNFYRPTLDITGPLNADKTAAYRLNIAYENAGSFRDFVNSENIFIAPALAFQLGKNTTLNLNVEYQRNRYTPDNIPTYNAIPEYFDIPINRFFGEPDINKGIINSWRASAILEHRFSEDWKLRSAFSTTLNTAKRTEVGGFLLEDSRTLERYFEKSDESSENYTLQNELVGKFKTGSIAHQVLFGVELFRERYSFFLQDAPIAPIDFFNPVYGAQPGPLVTATVPGAEIKTDALGVYVQDQITITDQLKLLVGGRFDLATSKSPTDRTGEFTSEQTDSAFSPRAGIVYQPIKPVSLYFSYATSFVPQAFGFSATGETFDPERGRQFELGIKADLIPDRLSATLAGYEITKKNVLVTDPNDNNFSIQTGEQKSRGIEFNLVGEPTKGWNIALSYAYTDAFVSRDTDRKLIGDQLVGVPAHQFGLWNSYEFYKGPLKGFGVGLGLYYSSKAEAALPNTFLLPSYFRADASVFYKRDNWELQLSVNNLTNTQYYLGPGVVPQAPLTVLGSFSIKF